MDRLRSARPQRLKLHLLCGLVLHVVVEYCAPARGQSLSGAKGLYPQLALFGFSRGYSPALVDTVSRAAVLYPSFEIARGQLARQGVHLGIKTVEGITHRLGAELLTKRSADLHAWRRGTLACTNELEGKRIAVAVDGGRVRLREKRRRQIGRGKHKKRKRRYTAAWREPKLLTIFELDSRGRMKSGSQAVIDGTFEGPDAVMELLAMQLHRLGAARAKHITFLADGAPWIWSRWPWVVQTLGLSVSQVSFVLDWCHAVHHVGLAVADLKVNQQARQRIFRRLRRHLRHGRVNLVLKELRQRAGRRRRGTERWRVIDYLEAHRDHMDYQALRASGRPMGSGAIESAVRRVINQRLKGNGITWLQDHAESMIALRAAALSGRWDQTLAEVRAQMATSRRTDWHWSSPDLTAPLADEAAGAPAPGPVDASRERSPTFLNPRSPASSGRTQRSVAKPVTRNAA